MSFRFCRFFSTTANNSTFLRLNSSFSNVADHGRRVVNRTHRGLENKPRQVQFRLQLSLPRCRHLSSFQSGYLLYHEKSETRTQHRRQVQIRQVRFAGHSHWHNIRHIKESNDALKQKMAVDVVRKIKLAVREGGSTNPKLNSALARALEDGKTKDVSNVTMLETLKRMEKAKDVKGSTLFVEAKGIGNCMLIIETYTERPKWTRQQVQHVLKQFGGSVGEAGLASHSFRFKGLIYLLKSKEMTLKEDQVVEVAIEVGAEEVVDGFDDDNQESYLFICDPKQLHSVKKSLEKHGLTASAARLEYVPHTFTKLDEAYLGIASKMLDGLEALDDVTRVYDNIES